jgi:2-amino-4-hydroxy-6-hydroxymethyldihydropteridine diphosphokinase
VRRRYWLGLGANLGDRRAALEAALAWLDREGQRVEAVSPAYETAPREVEDQPSFLNAAARVASAVEPPELLAQVKRMERELGRDPDGPRFGPRAIDCDLLLWEGGAWSGPDLEIPHPRLAERRFALLPLLDLDPGLALPDGRRLAATLAGRDAATDIALLRAAEADGGAGGGLALPPEAGDAEATLRPGHLLLALGLGEDGPIAALGIAAAAGYVLSMFMRSRD